MEVIEKRDAWNKGKLVGQKPPLKPKDIWAIVSGKREIISTVILAITALLLARASGCLPEPAGVENYVRPSSGSRRP
jgi:hypothetical protein